ncbi:hypothetical protein ACJX0J_021359, partial [Zea mays]
GTVVYLYGKIWHQKFNWLWILVIAVVFFSGGLLVKFGDHLSFGPLLSRDIKLKIRLFFNIKKKNAYGYYLYIILSVDGSIQYLIKFGTVYLWAKEWRFNWLWILVIAVLVKFGDHLHQNLFENMHAMAMQQSFGPLLS